MCNFHFVVVINERKSDCFITHAYEKYINKKMQLKIIEKKKFSFGNL